MTALQPEPTVPDEDHSNGAAWTNSRPPGLPGHIRPWTPAEQAEHLAELAEGISGFAVTVALARARARTEVRP